MKIIERKLIQSIKTMKTYKHKYDYGKVLIIGGSKGMNGAAFISGEASLEMGSGLVYVSLEHNDIMYRPELMTINHKDIYNIDLTTFDCIAIGPGLRNDKESNELFLYLINNISNNQKLVIDAGGIHIARNYIEQLKKIENEIVMTPHEGEFKIFFDLDKNTSRDIMENIATEFTKSQTNILIVLKGENTTIHKNEITYKNVLGSNKMSSPGMGDSLTGIITSFIGQSYSIENASILGVYYHSLTADEISKTKHKVQATDVNKMISIVYEIEKSRI